MEAEEVVHTIEPVFDGNSRVLVLGSFPSPKSRETRFYYGHPHNRFWKVLARLFDEPLATTNERKRDQLLRHHIALWDVLASCTIRGASDASIADAVPNDLRRILDAAPIEAVFCSGSRAHELYRRFFDGMPGVPPAVRLPSTSPANAAWKLDALAGEWSVLLEHVHEFEPPALDVPRVVALEQAIAAAGTSLAELMDRAGTFLARRVHALCPQGAVAVLCGNGNNGGDGWVAARELLHAGHDVRLVCAKPPEELAAQPARDAALAVLPQLEAGGARVLVAPGAAQLQAALDGADVVVDAMLGTGFSHESVRAPFDAWVETANAHRAQGALTVAADVPSGLSAQTGVAARPCIQADETVTMIVPKPGLASGEGPQLCGDVTVAGIAYIESLIGGSRSE